MELNDKSTLIILDWDDTLFPTTWINKNKIDIFNNKTLLYEKFFKNLDIILYKLFKLLLKCGNVIIITNALLNWIDISSTLLPNINKLLNNNIELTNLYKIKIISARGEYSHINKDPEIWKKMAFKNELEKIYKNKYINNIISIGDAEYEYFALINLYDTNINTYKLLKSIKFIRYPNITQIYKQIDLLHAAIINICKETRNLDLEFVPTR